MSKKNLDAILLGRRSKKLDPNTDQDEHFPNEEFLRILANLTPQEEKIIRMRHGIGRNHEHTYEEIARWFSMSAEKIQEIEKKALDKLQHPASKSARIFRLIEKPSIEP
ncbi:MAG: sigma factor-like helix-turn-helix DNA-binding protein [Patescibacteria group bacterium]